MDTTAALKRVLASGEPLLLVIAGPNGAGKTTFFETCLEAELRIPFVNADRIAKSLPPKAPGTHSEEVAFNAAKLMREQLLASRVSFCMEMFFSDPVGDKLSFFRQAQAAGYMVCMIFIGLASPELSAKRIDQRVADGGHDVPADRIRDRFSRVLANRRKALRFLDLVIVLDNSEVLEVYREIAVYERRRSALARERSAGVVQAASIGCLSDPAHLLSHSRRTIRENVKDHGPGTPRVRYQPPLGGREGSSSDTQRGAGADARALGRGE